MALNIRKVREAMERGDLPKDTEFLRLDPRPEDIVREAKLSGDEKDRYVEMLYVYQNLVNAILLGKDVDMRRVRELEVELAGKLGGSFAGGVAKMLEQAKRNLVLWHGEVLKERFGGFKEWWENKREEIPEEVQESLSLTDEVPLTQAIDYIIGMLKFIGHPKARELEESFNRIVEAFMKLGDKMAEIDPEEVWEMYMEKVNPIVKELDRTIRDLKALEDKNPEEVRVYFERRWAEEGEGFLRE